MTEYDGYQDSFRTIMRLIAVIMLINLLWTFLSPSLANRFIEPSDEVGTKEAMACSVVWIVLMVLSVVSLIVVAVRMSETAATFGMLLGWPVALTIPYLFGSVAYLVISSIIPLIMTVLVIRMLHLAFLIEWKRPPRPKTDYPVAPPADRTR